MHDLRSDEACSFFCWTIIRHPICGLITNIRQMVKKYGFRMITMYTFIFKTKLHATST